MKKDSQSKQDSGGVSPKGAGQLAKKQGTTEAQGLAVTRTVSTVGHVKQKNISQADLDQAAPSGKSDIDPGGSEY